MTTRPSESPARKPRFPRAVAIEVARELCHALGPCCDRLVVAGSLRRRKQEVGDVEILYIPKVGLATDGELFDRPKNLVDMVVEDLLHRFILGKRTNAKGSVMYGEKNKLLRHTLSGVPVDLFAATAENWFNYLVCRTGGAESNTRVAVEARKRGYKWNPYGVGFERLAGGEIFPMRSEEDVFRFVGLPFLEPCDRR